MACNAVTTLLEKREIASIDQLKATGVPRRTCVVVGARWVLGNSARECRRI